MFDLDCFPALTCFSPFKYFLLYFISFSPLFSFFFSSLLLSLTAIIPTLSVSLSVCVSPLILSLCVPVLFYTAGDISVTLYLFIDGDAGESLPAYTRAPVQGRRGALCKCFPLFFSIVSPPNLAPSKYLSNLLLMVDAWGRPWKRWLSDLPTAILGRASGSAPTRATLPGNRNTSWKQECK